MCVLWFGCDLFLQNSCQNLVLNIMHAIVSWWGLYEALWKLGVVMHVHNPSTQESDKGDHHTFKAILVYIVRSSPEIHSGPCFKIEKQFGHRCEGINNIFIKDGLVISKSRLLYKWILFLHSHFLSLFPCNFFHHESLTRNHAHVHVILLGLQKYRQVSFKNFSDSGILL